MSALPEASRQADNILAPTAGEISNITVSAVAGSVDLTTIGPQTEPDGNTKRRDPGMSGHYMSIYADGVDVYVLFGKDSASVTGSNAPVIATTGSNAAGCCIKIPNGQERQLRPSVGIHRFMGYIASGNGTMRVWRSSE